MRSTTLRSLSRVASRFALLSLIALPLSCGDDDPSEPTEVAAADFVTAVNANNIAALDGVPFTFENAGALFSPELAAQDVNLTLETSGATPRATLKFEGGGEVVANLSFGSCIFAVASSTFPTGHRLAQGQTVTLNPCNLRLGTQGAPADNIARARAAVFILGGAASTGTTVTVTVNKNGTITVNGAGVGSVTLVPVSS